MNIKYDKIGFRLAKRRKKLKYTQPQLAEIVGISKNHISQFEKRWFSQFRSIIRFVRCIENHSRLLTFRNNSRYSK